MTEVTRGSLRISNDFGGVCSRAHFFSSSLLLYSTGTVPCYVLAYRDECIIIHGLIVFIEGSPSAYKTVQMYLQRQDIYLSNA